MKLLKEKHFISVFRLFMLHLKGKKNKAKKVQVPKENASSSKYVIKNETGKKIAIYTCITGSYDNVEEPLVMESGCDYFLFTNNKNLKSDCWQIKEIPEKIASLENNTKINRYIKMHPAELFEGYDYSIYIDGNIKLVSVISSIVNKVSKESGLAIHRHSSNNCISKEIIDCRAYGKGNYKKLKSQVDRYFEEGFQKEYGMLECNVLVMDLKNKDAVHVFDEWWKEYLNSESGRDQIALPYVLWKNNVKVDEIATLGENVNKNPLFKINSHI